MGKQNPQPQAFVSPVITCSYSVFLYFVENFSGLRLLELPGDHFEKFPVGHSFRNIPVVLIFKIYNEQFLSDFLFEHFSGCLFFDNFIGGPHLETCFFYFIKSLTEESSWLVYLEWADDGSSCASKDCPSTWQYEPSPAWLTNLPTDGRREGEDTDVGLTQATDDKPRPPVCPVSMPLF